VLGGDEDALVRRDAHDDLVTPAGNETSPCELTRLRIARPRIGHAGIARLDASIRHFAAVPRTRARVDGRVAGPSTFGIAPARHQSAGERDRDHDDRMRRRVPRYVE